MSFQQNIEALINAMVHNDYSSEVTPVVEIYSDRLTITSYGGLVNGFEREEFFAGRSMPRNRELMRIYRDLKLVEQLGSGIHRILKVYDRSIFKFSSHFLEISFPFEQDFNEEFTDNSKATEQVTEQVNSLIISMEAKKEYSSSDLMKLLKINHRPTFLYTYLQRAIDFGFLEMTIPEKPNSSKQRYRLTEIGKKYKNPQ